MELDKELTAKQEAWVEYMLRPESDGGALVAVDMGLGKTRVAAMFAKASGARCVLIPVPHSTLEDWEATFNVVYPSLPVRLIDSTKEGVKAMQDFQWRVDGAYLVTHQYWERQAWVKTLKKKRRKTDPDKYENLPSGVWEGPGYTMIFDEAHRAANRESGTHNALMCLDPRVFKVALSGTFMGDQFSGAYGATRWIWPHRTDIIPPNYFNWTAQWAKIKYDKFAPRNQKVIGEKDEGAFVSALPCYIREETKEPPAVEHEVRMDLYEEQRRVYNELDDRMVAWIMDNPLTAEYSITKRARQRQTALAMPSLEFDEETDELLDVYFKDDADSVKTDELIANIRGEGELKDLMVGQQLLLLTDSQKYARLLTRRLNKEFGPDSAREWSGQTRKKPMKRNPDGLDRQTIKQEFIDGKIKYLVGVPSAMGTGTDGLQYSSCSIVVLMSRADRRIDNEQGIARLRRKGQEKIVHVVAFIARDTVDTGQLSKQMEDALKMQRSAKAKYREEQRERERKARAEILGW